MAEFAYNGVQTIQPNNPIPLTTVIPCAKGYVYHRNGSGIVTLRGVVNGTGCFARYQVTFNGNVAVAADGTPGAIGVAVALDGEPIATSRAVVNSAVGEYFNVTSTAIITVPKGCCFNVSVENVPGGITAAQAIDVMNATLVVTRIA